jgi:heterodisulfide reductase subunit B
MRLSYYPGCSLHATAREYGLSTRAVCEALGIKLVEIPDWCCCGASSAHSLNHALSIALPARNIASAQAEGLDLVVPCAACFGNMRRADAELRANEGLRSQIEEWLSFQYSGELQVLHLLDVICNRVGLDAVRQRVVKQLTGLKVAPYYGCLLVRPPKVCGFDDAENPTTLDNLIAALGAEPVKWSYKTECCGASLALIQPEIVEKLVGEITEMALEAEASCIATACPLCSTNLETRQKVGLPVFFFTELMGLAFDLEGCEKWLKMHLVETGTALELLQSQPLDAESREGNGR